MSMSSNKPLLAFALSPSGGIIYNLLHFFPGGQMRMRIIETFNGRPLPVQDRLFSSQAGGGSLHIISHSDQILTFNVHHDPKRDELTVAATSVPCDPVPPHLLFTEDAGGMD